jgi:dihydroxyacetone kinase phosphotransfer subunit
MVGLVIVSHSPKVAEGAVDLAQEMAHGYDQLVAAGGLDDGTIGTDAVRIKEAIERADDGDGVVVLCDVGSSIMSTETAMDLLESDITVRIADAPIIEGVIAAAVSASIGQDIAAVVADAEDAKSFSKL